MKYLAATLLALLILATIGCTPKVDNPSDIAALKEKAAMWDKSFNAGDVNALADGYYSENAVIVNQFAPPSVGNVAIRKGFEDYFAQSKGVSHSAVEDVHASGNLAAVLGSYDEKTGLKTGDYSAQQKGKFVTVFERQANGSWKALWDTSSSVLPLADSLSIGPDELAVLEVERKWIQGFLKSDIPMLEKTLAPEWAINMEGLIVKRPEYLAGMKSGTIKVESYELANMRPVVMGDFAIVEGSHVEKSRFQGKDSSGKYHWFDIFARRGGNWQCVSSYIAKVK